MPVHLATMSATSSSSTSSFSIAPSTLERDEPIRHRLELALEYGEMAVAELRGAFEIAVALGAIRFETRGLEPLLAVTDRRDRFLLALPVRDHPVALLGE